MLKIGENEIRLPGVARAYVGDDLVYGLPAGYKRLTGIIMSAATYYVFTGFRLTGADTLRVSFKVDRACNVLGCYTTTAAQTNYSLYASTSSGAKYLRYNGSTYASAVTVNTRYDVVITPTGASGLPGSGSWAEKTFTAESDFLIGSTSVGATSSKFDGTMYGEVVVDGRLRAIPVEKISDGTIGYYETHTKAFIAPTGSNPQKLGYAA